MRRLLVTAVLALATVLGACGSDSVTNPVVQSSMAGRWSLVSMNGVGLPVIIAQVGEDNFQIVSDVITADSTGKFTELTMIQSLVNGQVAMDTIPDGGTWTVSGTSVAITFNSDGSTAIGSIVGNTLGLQDGAGDTMMYTKQ